MPYFLTFQSPNREKSGLHYSLSANRKATDFSVAKFFLRSRLYGRAEIVVIACATRTAATRIQTVLPRVIRVAAIQPATASRSVAAVRIRRAATRIATASAITTRVTSATRITTAVSVARVARVYADISATIATNTRRVTTPKAISAAAGRRRRVARTISAYVTKITHIVFRPSRVFEVNFILYYMQPNAFLLEKGAQNSRSF